MSITTRLVKIAAPLAALATLGACAAPGFNTQVSRFNALPAQGVGSMQGQTFFITTDDPALAGGIEFGQYANQMSQELMAEGFVPAASAESADLVVNMGYKVVDTKMYVYRSSGYSSYGLGYAGSWGGYWGRSPVGYGRHRGHTGFVPGFFDPWLDRPLHMQNVTVYTTQLDVRIDRRADGTRVFEGKAMARSNTDNLQKVVPNLVVAMFTGFPGNNGETVKITVLPEPKPR